MRKTSSFENQSPKPAEQAQIAPSMALCLAESLREWIVVGRNRRNSVMVPKCRLSSSYKNIQVSHFGVLGGRSFFINPDLL
jgi:hypothetical protein